MVEDRLQAVRERTPLVHCMANIVTANDCANLLLAVDASPVMAEDPEEVREITALSSGLVLNLGTPGPRKIQAMHIAAQTAGQRKIPAVLDPVGAGCSQMRSEAAAALLQTGVITAIRLNASEAEALLRGAHTRRGVDADAQPAAETAMALAAQTGAVVIATGKTDIVTDGRSCFCVHNGCAMMRFVTGAGCQLSALTGAFLAASPDRPLEAALAAACAMGLCGEIAHSRLQPGEGPSALRMRIIDAMYHLTPDQLRRGARYEQTV